ncbi:Participates in the translocation of lipoproteins from the inner membrane to the outer membrane. Only forms a complex with a lipoprotein if the residue after the N-terminal Cys is not an aspartate (The Asp acts as a targeting signal to indicate that the lipoprotein should stay in the inner membrane) [Vibrio sp. B1REV9]|uniref:outer membrane lipoprotein chaperone LolA n=1 Tax=Vibrio sp. B1REV9 TaxID=2751179 RepID=UPI001AF75F8E|nr:outer membrane lipoprotein chaperone LolA [Vibrio sp. B1REV9]CAE6901396.1 Participates in the translocation of lipoproteins from the inner membrane to the outer membrane. Only forms a complex with a lipoprotein if the residue after the N-terminal Cys is not an aspartate (The Asp acts as a targeting signal to indicate that the lipoprotein should stay in the inner membrane) [Vibrio sp. B1REV9]
MKKRFSATFFSVFVLSLSLFSTAHAASAKDELNKRLAMNEGFSADFSQQVISPEGETIMEGEGSVEIARPSLFRWSTTFPDENLLVSDGKSLWYYSPFIEQVSIYDQAQATEQTPFVLLTRNRASDWDNYTISQKGDQFTLVPTAIDSTQGQFQINIDTKGVVNGFNVIEQDGQKGLFEFSNVKLGKPKADRFTFTIPDGVEVDDQRN